MVLHEKLETEKEKKKEEKLMMEIVATNIITSQPPNSKLPQCVALSMCMLCVKVDVCMYKDGGLLSTPKGSSPSPSDSWLILT